MTDILKVADDAKMIVNGYTYTPKENQMTEDMNCLTEHLGSLKAEMFVAAIIRENFDYTEWQRVYFDAKSPEDISREASQHEKDHPFQGPAVRLSHRLRPEDPDPVVDHF